MEYYLDVKRNAVLMHAPKQMHPKRAEWKKPDTEGHMVYCSIDRDVQRGLDLQTECRLVVSGDLRVVGLESDC